MGRQRLNVIVCAPDCKERSETCHGTCRKYIAFRKAQEKKYKERANRELLNSFTEKSVMRARKRGMGLPSKFRPR